MSVQLRVMVRGEFPSWCQLSLDDSAKIAHITNIFAKIHKYNQNILIKHYLLGFFGFKLWYKMISAIYSHQSHALHHLWRQMQEINSNKIEIVFFKVFLCRVSQAEGNYWQENYPQLLKQYWSSAGDNSMKDQRMNPGQSLSSWLSLEAWQHLTWSQGL